jgi:hypothetical protein
MTYIHVYNIRCANVCVHICCDSDKKILNFKTPIDIYLKSTLMLLEGAVRQFRKLRQIFKKPAGYVD